MNRGASSLLLALAAALLAASGTPAGADEKTYGQTTFGLDSRYIDFRILPGAPGDLDVSHPDTGAEGALRFDHARLTLGDARNGSSRFNLENRRLIVRLSAGSSAEHPFAYGVQTNFEYERGLTLDRPESLSAGIHPYVLGRAEGRIEFNGTDIRPDQRTFRPSLEAGVLVLHGDTALMVGGSAGGHFGEGSDGEFSVGTQMSGVMRLRTGRFTLTGEQRVSVQTATGSGMPALDSSQSLELGYLFGKDKRWYVQAFVERQTTSRHEKGTPVDVLYHADPTTSTLTAGVGVGFNFDGPASGAAK